MKSVSSFYDDGTAQGCYLNWNIDESGTHHFHSVTRKPLFETN